MQNMFCLEVKGFVNQIGEWRTLHKEFAQLETDDERVATEDAVNELINMISDIYREHGRGGSLSYQGICINIRDFGAISVTLTEQLS